MGIWMSGRMSVGLVEMEPTPAMRIRKEMITKVYGLRSANLTSHMNVAPYITLRSALPQNDSCRSDHQDGDHERQDGGIDVRMNQTQPSTRAAYEQRAAPASKPPPPCTVSL